jgi:uncharacterized heparinase superfamily protein
MLVRSDLLRLHYLLHASPRMLYAGCSLAEAAPAPLWPTAQPPTGGKLLKRRFDLAGCTVEMPGRIAWHPQDASPLWLERFYGFRWLRDLAATKKHREAASFAREFINGFILEGEETPAVAWEPRVAGERLALWLEHLELIMDGSSRAFRQRFARAVIRHTLALRRHVESGGETTLAVLWGIAAAAYRFRPLRFLFALVGDKLVSWIAANIREDGMCRGGMPGEQLSLVRMLLDIQALTPGAGALTASELARILPRMGTMLRFCCHGDGRLALFGGAILEDAGIIARAVALSHSTGALPRNSTGGLCRLHCGESRAFLLASYGASAHGGFKAPLAFEFSDGTERIVVNCGAYLGADVLWAEAMRSAAAHSTLSFESALPTAPEGYRPPPPRIESTDAAEGQHLRATLEVAPGLTHIRTLLLHGSSTQLSGKDQITCQTREAAAQQAALRFHLHPDIRCQRTGERSLTLTPVSGRKWSFFITGEAPLLVEESVYLGYKGKPQRTLQIVLRPTLAEGMTELSWILSR